MKAAKIFILCILFVLSFTAAGLGLEESKEGFCAFGLSISLLSLIGLWRVK